MKIHLVRHGEAENGKIDFDRGLSSGGIEQVKKLADYMKKTVSLEQIWCSGAKRTRETLSLFYKGLAETPIEYNDDLYLCALGDYLSLFTSRAFECDLLIVGHNNGISDLASYLLDDTTGMSTSEYLVIDCGELKSNELVEGTGTLIDRVHFPL